MAQYSVGDRYCVCIPDGFDEQGDWDGWHYEWFRTEIAAKAALEAAEPRRAVSAPTTEDSRG